MNEKYQFIWEAFPEHLREFFKELREEGNFADVTLVCDDEIKIVAHKVVLSACSPVFKRLLLNSPQSHPMIELSEIRSSELQAILEFMYSGKTQVFIDRFDHFLSLAQHLRVKSICQEEIVEHVDIVKKDIIAQVDKNVYFVEIKQENVLEENSDFNLHETVDLHSVRNESASERELEVNVNENSKTKNKAKEYKKTDVEKLKDLRRKIKQEPNPILKREASKAAKRIRKRRSEMMGMGQDGTFSCNGCDWKGQTRDGQLKHHMSKHEGERLFCDECGVSYSQTNNLFAHKKTKHMGDKFSCTVCAFKTSHPSSLSRHMKLMHN